jgi:2-C-methyl-D-erythritol 4-phosphate cytidylyltransferase
MGTETPKQFLLLNGKPMLQYSLEAFHQFDPGISIVLVLPADYLDEWSRLKDHHTIKIDHQIIAGGDTRYQSVKNGLDLVSEEGIVAVHDGARPLIQPATIERLFTRAGKKGNAVPYSLPSDSVRLERKDTSVIIDRSSIRMIQTPQVFEAGMLKQAYEQKESSSFTDDASVFEKAGGKVHLVECPADNIKITRPGDLRIAEALLKG